MGLRGSDNPVNDFMGLNRGKPDPRSMKKIISGQRTGDVIRPATFGDQQRHRRSHYKNKPALVGPQQPVFRNPGASKRVQSLKEGIKSHAKFYFGSTPREFVEGEAIGVGLSVVGGLAWKGVKGAYGVGKAIYKGYKKADSMVPGNRPPRPKTPVAPNPADVEGRRNVLKGGLALAAGGAVGVSKNMEQVVDLGQQVLRKVKGQGRRLIPKGWIGESATISAKRLSKASDDYFYQESGMKAFNKKFGHDSAWDSGYIAEDIADFLSEGNEVIDLATSPRMRVRPSAIPPNDKTIPKIIGQTGKTRVQISNELRRYSEEAKWPHEALREASNDMHPDEFLYGQGEEFLEQSTREIVEKTRAHIPEKLKPFMDIETPMGAQEIKDLAFRDTVVEVGGKLRPRTRFENQIRDKMQSNVLKEMKRQGFGKKQKAGFSDFDDVVLEIGRNATSREASLKHIKELRDQASQFRRTFRNATEAYKKSKVPNIDSSYEVVDTGPRMIEAYKTNVSKFTRKAVEAQKALDARFDLPDQMISEVEIRNILKDNARHNRTSQFNKNLESLKGSTDMNKSVGEQKLRKQFEDDLKIIDQAKRTRGRYAQNRTPFV